MGRVLEIADRDLREQGSPGQAVRTGEFTDLWDTSFCFFVFLSVSGFFFIYLTTF